ncbi:hypothetical protein MLD38_039577 [Melastoma candidum]|uniref:Uncharacterized protein n=1 Tax=Melastoma candidum TaxID=119954 RepID=A0ACB9L393_9MYRT|nr:hypothetical protein MLD38_039577 [Melastoma candidum]
MALADQDVPKSPTFFPLDPDSYKIHATIGVGVNAVVYKGECIPQASATVAIKSIDLDRSHVDLQSIHHVIKMMSLLSHRNILNAYTSFTVDKRLWLVMPFMAAGSLQSIVSSSFPNGLDESCIAIVLRDTLDALAYLHSQGHVHRHIKAGNILVDSDGTVKLADFGVSASIYELRSRKSWSGQEPPSSSSLMLTDITGTPYWMAPEVIHSHNEYSFEADIWSFGITALELAYGQPPLSHLPPSKSLLLKITRRFPFSDYEKVGNSNRDNFSRNLIGSKKFSGAFKDMVASCLDQDPLKRPTAEKLLKHPFFKNCKGSEYLVNHIINGLPSVEERFRKANLLRLMPLVKFPEGNDDGEDDGTGGSLDRRISGWNFDEDGFKLEPIFLTESMEDQESKQASSEEQTLELAHKSPTEDSNKSDLPGHTSGASKEECSNATNGGRSLSSNNEDSKTEGMLGSLVWLKKSLEDELETVINMIRLVGGEQQAHRLDTNAGSVEEQLLQDMGKLRNELYAERRKNSELEAELDRLRQQYLHGGVRNDGSGASSMQSP